MTNRVHQIVVSVAAGLAVVAGPASSMAAETPQNGAPGEWVTEGGIRKFKVGRPLAAAVEEARAAYGRDAVGETVRIEPSVSLAEVNARVFAPGTKVLFRRGGVWRGQLIARCGKPGHPVVYGAFGEGPKPVIQPSHACNDAARWRRVEHATAGTCWTIRTPAIADIGNIIFEDGAKGCAFKRTRIGEVRSDLDFWCDPETFAVWLKSETNPAERFRSVELCEKLHCIDEAKGHDIVYDGLALRYTAAHGIAGGDVSRITVRNCDISWIGGGFLYFDLKGNGVRYGNAIEFWANCEDTLVESNRIWECYDAGLTNQSNEDGAVQRNVVWRNNEVWNCEYSYEYWQQGRDAKTENVVVEGNRFRDAGRGWGHRQRWNPNAAHLLFYDTTAETRGFVVRSNVFSRSENTLFRFFNDWRRSLTFAGNVWIARDESVCRFHGRPTANLTYRYPDRLDQTHVDDAAEIESQTVTTPRVFKAGDLADFHRFLKMENDPRAADQPDGWAPKSHAGLGAVSLAGPWHVTGNGIDAVATLPGTTGGHRLGTRWTEHDFTVTMDLPQSEALCLEYQYVGKAVWERDFDVDAADAAHPLELYLERVMWKSAAFVDGRPCGTCDSLATAHVHPLGRLAPGRHRLRIEIDNSRLYNFSRQSHAYGPNMQAVWNGVLGRIEIRPRSDLDSVRVFARAPAERTFDLELPESMELTADAVSLEGFRTLGVWARPSPCAAGRKFVAVRLDGDPEPWSPLHPRLYALTLRSGGATRTLRIGFRTLGTSGRAITLNGHKIFTRGNVENTNFAKDGLPWMTKAEWAKMLRTLKEEDGVDTIRFHTWCPPEAAFAAADEVGVLLHPEGGIWTDRWMSEGDAIGWGKPVDAFVVRELRAIQDAYGNHPSMASLAIGNELGNSNFEVLGEMMRAAKAYDPRYLYTASSARWISSGDDFLLTASIPEHNSKNAMRILAREKLFPRTDWDYEDLYGLAPIPMIAHEIGQWPVYPLWDEFFRPFDGTLRPWNYTRHRRKAVAHDTLRFQREYHTASAKLSRLIYKEEVESFLRTPSCAGLQLLEVQDYTGQAEALVGWRDPFYGLKPAFRSLPAFATVWGPVSFLARFPRFTYAVGERFAAELQIRNLTDAVLPAGTEYACVFNGRTRKVRLERTTAPGELGSCGRFEVALDGSMTKAKQEFRFGTNRWNFWVFPAEEAAALPEGVVMTDDPKAMKEAVQKGKTVLYTGASRRSGKGQFKSVYWSARWFPVANTTGAALGTWFDVTHPALAGFPTEDFTDWQWYSLAEGATIHRLEGLPKGYRPFGLSVNDFHFSDFCATLFEVTVGAGRLFVCGYDLKAKTPEAKRLRASVFAYLAGAPAAGTPSVAAAWLDREFGEEKPRDLGGAVYDVAPKWEGPKYRLTIRDVPPTTGILRIDFHQPGQTLTSGRGLLEGRMFEVPFTEAVGAKTFVELPVIREDFLDGKLELEANVMTGPALAIDRIRIIPEK